MNNYRFSLPVRYVGTVVMVAAIALAGCQKNSESVASAPLAGAASQSPDYPMLTLAADRQTAPAAVSLTVTVSLNPAVARKAAPDDVVFIFARAAQGSRMPLAIVRKQVKDLPTTVVLDDSLGMGPQMKLSSVPEVVVVARVSKSGMASAQAGDLEGVSGPVKMGAQAISISIANVVGGQ
jgi:cytochrome c-type biogenesis protein CcmH